MMHNAHLVAHVFVGGEMHFAGPPVAPPPPSPPVLAPHVAGTTIINLTLTAKYSKTELGWGGVPLVARGNKATPAVPHIGPTNPLLVVAIAAGDSEVMFGSSKVKINVDGKAEDCGCCVFPCAPISLNQSCADPCNLPIDRVIAPNTVEVGMTLGDILGGALAIVANSVLSFALNKLGGKVNDAVKGIVARLTPGVWQAASRAYTEGLAEFLDDTAAKWAAQTARREAVEAWTGGYGSAVTGMASDLAQRLILAENPGDAFGGDTLEQRGAKKLAAGLLGEPDAKGPGQVLRGAAQSENGDQPPNSRIYSTDDEEGVVHTDDSIWD